MIIGVAVFLLVAVTIPHHRPIDVAVVVVPLAIAVWLAYRFTAHFRRTPAGFPAPTPATGLRVTQASRTTWGSSRRKAS